MILAGTGHRPNKLGGYARPVFFRCVTVITRWLEDAKNIEYGISGMAIGFDQALAQSCIDSGIPFDAYVPFLGQESKWPRDAQQFYHKLLNQAREVKYICDPGYHPLKMQKRNEAMVDACTDVLALWDGTTGGTANCIMYAKIKGKPIHNLWDTWKGQP